jgi:hypothetical protein
MQHRAEALFKIEGIEDDLRHGLTQREIEQEAVDIFRGECLMVGIDLGPMSGETVKRSLEAIKRAYREYMGE